MRRGMVVVALALSDLGCEPPRSGSDRLLSSSTATAPIASASSSASSTGSSTGASSKLRARPVAAGYGGVGPRAPSPHPDLWVVLIVDIEATEKLTGVAVEVELVDGAGTVVARAGPPVSLRHDSRTVGDDARRRGDFSQVGTSPFDGEAGPGRDLRLHVHAPLDVRAESLGPRPTRFRARIRAPGDPGAWVEGPLQGPWATG